MSKRTILRDVYFTQPPAERYNPETHDFATDWNLAYLNPGWGEPPEGWIRIGSARIEFELEEGDKITVTQIAGLREQIQKTRAEAEYKCRRLEGQIQSLLALEAPKPLVQAPNDDIPF